MSKNKFIIPALLGLLTFNLGFTLVLGAQNEFLQVENDSDDDGIEDEVEDEDERDVGLELELNKITIESTLRNGNQKDEISIEVKYGEDDGIEVDFGYEIEFEENNTETEKEMEFSVKFKNLIEYIDNNNNGIYEKLIDDKLQTYILNDTSLLDYDNSTLSSGNKVIYLKVGTNDGIFTLHIYLSEEYTLVNQSFIAPNQMKIDIEINGFNYLNNNSRLALYTRLDSQYEYEEYEDSENEEKGYIDDDEEKTVRTINSGYVGEFIWKKYAEVDGINKSVLTSNIETDDELESEQKFYLNYAHGDYIYHDPTMSIYTTSISKGIGSFLILGVLIASISMIGLIIVGIFIRSRK